MTTVDDYIELADSLYGRGVFNVTVCVCDKQQELMVVISRAEKIPNMTVAKRVVKILRLGNMRFRLETVGVCVLSSFFQQCADRDFLFFFTDFICCKYRLFRSLFFSRRKIVYIESVFSSSIGSSMKHTSYVCWWDDQRVVRHLKGERKKVTYNPWFKSIQISFTAVFRTLE